MELTNEQIGTLEILARHEHSYLQDQKRRAELSNSGGGYTETIAHIQTKIESIGDILRILIAANMPEEDDPS